MSVLDKQIKIDKYQQVEVLAVSGAAVLDPKVR
jgi:hypothetical protein